MALIAIDLRTRNEKRFFEIVSSKPEIHLLYLYKKIPVSSVYKIKERLNLFEDALGVRFFDVKEVLSKNNHISKVLSRAFYVDKFIDVSESRSIVLLRVNDLLQ